MSNQKKRVTIKKPRNLSNDEIYLFNDLSFDLISENPHFLKNVIVTKSGICLKNFRIVKASIHQYDHLYYSFYKVALGSLLLRKRKKLSTNEQYIIVHNIWSRGYYHWICEAMQRLWSVRHSVANYILLLPETYKESQLESLKLFKFKDIIFMDDRYNYLIPNLCLPANPQKIYEPDPQICNQIRDFFQQNIPSGILRQFNLGQRIYISRQKANSRKVANEERLYYLFEKYNFNVVCFEDYSFWEQLAIMYHAKCLISIHGAGLTNMHFMKEGGNILELYKKRVPKVDFGRVRQSDLPSPCYSRLASVLGHNHYIQFCLAIDNNVPAGSADLIVDEVELEHNILQMIHL